MSAATLGGLIGTLVAARHAGGYRYDFPERVLRQFAGHCRREGYADGSIVREAVEEFAEVRIAPGTLYEALARLERQGLIEPVESNDRRRPYRLTAAGALALRAHLDSQRHVAEVGLRRLASSSGAA